MPVEIIYPKVQVDGVPVMPSPAKESKLKDPQKSKIYCSTMHEYESNWLIPLGFSITSKIEDADLVVFGGGKDIDPGFYNQKKGLHTDSPSARDSAEKRDFEIIQGLRKEGKDIKAVGICRGLQLLCALSGGKLIQHVGRNHIGQHSITTHDKKTFKVNSIHHQMIFPYDMPKKDYKILAWSTRQLSSEYLDGWNKPVWLPEGFKEIEVAYFVNTQSLGIQAHPEMMYRNTEYSKFMDWMHGVFLKFFNNEL